MMVTDVQVHKLSVLPITFQEITERTPTLSFFPIVPQASLGTKRECSWYASVSLAATRGS